MIKIVVDDAGQKLKTATLRAVPQAFNRNVTQWASETVRYIKKELKSGRYFARAPKELDQRLGMVINRVGPTRAEIVIGTGGFIGKKEVVYAEIQERGGWIFPRNCKFLAFPRPGTGTKGSPRNFPKEEIGWRFIFTKNVKLPATHWFSWPILERTADRDRKMSADGVWATAQQLAYKRTPAQGGGT